MSVKYISAVWSNRNIGEQSTLLVMLALADFSNDEGWSWPSIPTLADKARISDRHVQRILKALEEQKILEIEHRGGRHNTNRYRLTLPICPVLFTLATPEETVTLRPETVTSATERVTPVSQKGDKLCPINRQEPSVKSNHSSKPSEIPDWINPETWQDFVEMRNRIKKPLTDRASRGIFTKLDKLRNRGDPAEDVLEQSIVNCWQDVFKLREEKQGNGNGTRAQQNQQDSRDAIAGAINSRLADFSRAGDGMGEGVVRPGEVNRLGDGGGMGGGVGATGEKTRERKIP